MPTRSSGFFIQGTFGAHDNFEAVLPGKTAGLAHVWRDNDDPALPWHSNGFFAAAPYVGPSLIQSNFGTGPGNLEVVARLGDQVHHFWREDQPPYTWHGPTIIAGGVTDNPALIQGSFGSKGNFEMVAPLAAGGIGHWWRDNDSATLDWHGPTVFGPGAGPVNGVAMLQNSGASAHGGSAGNLEVFVTLGSGVNRTMGLFWRDVDGWHGPVQIFLPNAFPPTSPDGVPGFVQTADGNFHAVVAGPGHLTHVMRDNSTPGLIWDPVAVIAPFPMTIFGAAGLIQTNYGPPGSGNLEALARKSDAGPGVVHINHYWRGFEPGAEWHGPSGDIAL